MDGQGRRNRRRGPSGSGPGKGVGRGGAQWGDDPTPMNVGRSPALGFMPGSPSPFMHAQPSPFMQPLSTPFLHPATPSPFLHPAMHPGGLGFVPPLFAGGGGLGGAMDLPPAFGEDDEEGDGEDAEGRPTAQAAGYPGAMNFAQIQYMRALQGMGMPGQPGMFGGMPGMPFAPEMYNPYLAAEMGFNGGMLPAAGAGPSSLLDQGLDASGASGAVGAEAAAQGTPISLSTMSMDPPASNAGRSRRGRGEKGQGQESKQHAGSSTGGIVNEEDLSSYTTVMLRNIPNKYTREMLVEQMNLKFKGKYDFLYLPIDFKNRCNVGYGFINFRTGEARLEFVQSFHNVDVRKCLPGLKSNKVAEVTPARVQGCEENVRRLWNSPVMNQLVPHPEWMPMIFNEFGEPEPFLKPDQSLSPKKPRGRGQLSSHFR